MKRGMVVDGEERIMGSAEQRSQRGWKTAEMDASDIRKAWRIRTYVWKMGYWSMVVFFEMMTRYNNASDRSDEPPPKKRGHHWEDQPEFRFWWGYLCGCQRLGE